MLRMNSVYSIPGGDRKWRLIYVHESPQIARSYVVLMPLTRGANPEVMALAAFHEHLDAGSLTPAADPYDHLLSASSNARPSQAARKDRAEPIVRALLEFAPDIFFPRHRIRCLQTVGAQYGVSRQTLMGWLREWWIGGQIPAALLGNRHRCGIYDLEKAKHAPRGRRPVLSDRDIFVLTSTDIRIVGTALKRWYLKRRDASLSSAYENMVKKYYSVPADDGIPQPLPEGKRPSLAQFRYQLEKNHTYEERRRAKMGNIEFQLKAKPSLASAIGDAFGPGHFFELDATIDNTHLVSRFDRSRNIGRPTLYLVRDRWSRYISGFFVTLESPSWIGAASALVCIVEDKASLCRRYGVPYESADWAEPGLPAYVIADRAECISHASDQSVRDIGVKIGNTPPYRGDYKPFVENGFRLAQVLLRDEVPGYKVPTLSNRGPKRRQEREAVLTFHEYIAQVLQVIIRLNTSIVKGYPLTPEMVADGVHPIPVELYRWGLKHRSGKLHYLPPEQVTRHLLPRDEAKVTSDGIVFRHCYYTCARAMKDGWFAKAVRNSWAIEVSYDPRCVNTLYLRDPKAAGGYVELELLEKSRILYSDWSFAEVEENVLATARLEHAAEDRSLGRAVRHKSLSEPAIQRARKDARAASKPLSSGAARTKDQKVWRAREIQVLRVEQAHPKGRAPVAKPALAQVISLTESQSSPTQRPSEGSLEALLLSNFSEPPNHAQ